MDIFIWGWSFYHSVILKLETWGDIVFKWFIRYMIMKTKICPKTLFGLPSISIAIYTSGVAVDDEDAVGWWFCNHRYLYATIHPSIHTQHFFPYNTIDRLLYYILCFFVYFFKYVIWWAPMIRGRIVVTYNLPLYNNDIICCCCWFC